MSPEKEQELYAKYPRVFKQRDLSVTKSCMGWGITCGEGWYGLVETICQKIEEIYAQIPDTYKSEYFLTAAQVKQKLGGLRFYIDAVYHPLPKPPQLDALYRFIDEIDKKSMEVCEDCGAPGKRAGRYWLSTLCDTHREPTK
jgi:hypothetical protein